MKLTERKRKALFAWACNQSAQRLASLLCFILSNRQMNDVIEGEGITIQK